MNMSPESNITTKNLTILEDQMKQEALSNKKMRFYAASCQDQQLKPIYERAASMHKQHFDTLYNYLNSHNKPLQ